jgi:putative toxin-antitoxin system antitoxin component (TIGR02293 family)
METFQPPAATQEGVLAGLGLGAGRTAWIAAAKAGLSTEVFVRLALRLGVSEARLAEVVGLSSTTLARRKRAGAFTPAEGERVLRVAVLLHRAAEVFGDEDEAAAWLATENAALDHATPLSWAETEFGASEVEDLLGRLEYGVYS